MAINDFEKSVMGETPSRPSRINVTPIHFFVQHHHHTTKNYHDGI
jgi:hypothetical protein